MHSFLVKELSIPSIKRNTSQIHPFSKIPTFGIAMVIALNYAIGEL